MHSEALTIRAVLWNSLRAFGAALPALTATAAGAAAVLLAIVTAVVAINWGVALQGGAIDPKVLAATLDGRKFAVLGVGLVLALIPLSYFAGVTVQAGADPGASLKTLIARVEAKGLQLFWLQWAVNILAIRFSPFAAILLWLAIAAAIPVAILEKLGPMPAIERLHGLAAGNRLKLLGLVVILSLMALVFPVTLGLAIFGANPTGAALPPLLRLGLAIPSLAVALVPAQIMLIGLTRAYLDLAGREALHVEGAGDVKS